MPALRQRCRSSAVTLAVSAMIGVWRVRPSRSRMKAVALKPSICGIWQSMRTAS